MKLKQLKWTIHPVLCNALPAPPSSDLSSRPLIQEVKTPPHRVLVSFQRLVIMQNKTFVNYHYPLHSALSAPALFPDSQVIRACRSHRAKSRTYIPAPILICLTIFLSSTTSPLALRICSNASKTRSKDDLAPFSCVKRAMAMLARRPRWRRVWNSAAMEREGMRSAARKLAYLGTWRYVGTGKRLVRSRNGKGRNWELSRTMDERR